MADRRFFAVLATEIVVIAIILLGVYHYLNPALTGALVGQPELRIEGLDVQVYGDLAEVMVVIGNEAEMARNASLGLKILDKAGPVAWSPREPKQVILEPGLTPTSFWLAIPPEAQGGHTAVVTLRHGGVTASESKGFSL